MQILPPTRKYLFPNVTSIIQERNLLSRQDHLQMLCKLKDLICCLNCHCGWVNFRPTVPHTLHNACHNLHVTVSPGLPDQPRLRRPGSPHRPHHRSLSPSPRLSPCRSNHIIVTTLCSDHESVGGDHYQSFLSSDSRPWRDRYQFEPLGATLGRT